MAKTKRKPLPAERLDGPTDAQFANGIYERADIIHADLAQRVTVHLNRGGTPVMRWHSTGRLTDRQFAAIAWCQRLWHLLDTSAPVTSKYGERIKSTSSAELRAVKWLAADEDLTRIRSHVSKTAWSVFENVCRFDMAAGVAGSELGYGSRSAEVRAHTLVCEVADRIVEKEKL